MHSYRVTWEIDVEAETPREAAEQAKAIQQDPGSWASVFSCLQTDYLYPAKPKLFHIDLAADESEDYEEP